MCRLHALAAFILAPIAAVHGMQSVSATAEPHRAVVVKQGVRVTVSLPQRSYPRNALVRVWIGARNVSNHTIYVPESCAGPSNPHITVLTGTGHIVFPPLIPTPAPSGPVVMGCMAAKPIPLKPGHSLHWRQDAVLRGTQIMAHIGLGNARSYGHSSRWITGRLRVQLTPPDAPTITIHSAPSTTIDVTSTSGSGPFVVNDWWFCPGDDRLNGPNERTTTIAGSTISVPCSRPTEWHGVVAQIGHSLAQFDYVQSST